MCPSRPSSPIRRVAALAATSLTNTDSGTPSPISASRARDDVPASLPMTVAERTAVPMTVDRVAASMSPTERGNPARPPSTASAVSRPTPRARWAARPTADNARLAGLLIGVHSAGFGGWGPSPPAAARSNGGEHRQTT